MSEFVDFHLPYSRELLLSEADHILLHNSMIEATDTAFNHDEVRTFWRLQGIPITGSKRFLAYNFLDVQAEFSHKQTVESTLSVHGHPLGLSVEAIFDAETKDGFNLFHDNGPSAPVPAPRADFNPRMSNSEVSQFLTDILGVGSLPENIQHPDSIEFDIHDAMFWLARKLSNNRKAHKEEKRQSISTPSQGGGHPTTYTLARTRTRLARQPASELLTLSAKTVFPDIPLGDHHVPVLNITKELVYEISAAEGPDGDHTSARLEVRATTPKPLRRRTDNLATSEKRQQDNEDGFADYMLTSLGVLQQQHVS